jgi:hypothetical protein
MPCGGNLTENHQIMNNCEENGKLTTSLNVTRHFQFLCLLAYNQMHCVLGS